MASPRPVHLRIFVSSPGDVPEERRLAREMIEAVARQPLLKGQVTFDVISYDDADAPAPMSATQTPQVSVNRYSGRPAECDLTIVVLWSRLGTPLPEEIRRDDGTRYESGTVWELEDARTAQREIWIYRRTQEPVIGSGDPEHEQKRTALAAVDEFLRGFTNLDGSIASGFNRYTSPADFAPLLKKHLYLFVRNRLELARQQSVQPPHTSSTSSWNWPRPWDFSGYIADRRRGFVGRKWLFKEVLSWINDTAGPQALLICADFGVGKSAFAAELLSRTSGGHSFLHHFCHHDTAETLNPARFVRSIAAQFAATIPEYKSAVEGDPEARKWLDDAQLDCASAFERAVVGPLNSGSGDRTIKLWNPANSALEAKSEGHSLSVTVIAVLLDGRLASGSWNNTIKLWNPTSCLCEATLEGHSNAVTSLVVLPDGRLVSASMDRTIKLWNLASGTCETWSEAHLYSVDALAALPNGRLVSGSSDNKIKLWNLASGVCEASWEGHSRTVSAVTALPDGRFASGSFDKTIKLWNPPSGVREVTLKGHSASLTALAVLPDGRLASASMDKTIKLWNPTSGACEATLEGHSDSVVALAVLPDGRFASASRDRTVRIWETRRGHVTGSLQFVANAEIRALAFAPKVSSVVAGDDRGRLHFLELLQTPRDRPRSQLQDQTSVLSGIREI
jgi:WD40 repeat protein